MHAHMTWILTKIYLFRNIYCKRMFASDVPTLHDKMHVQLNFQLYYLCMTDRYQYSRRVMIANLFIN